MIKLKETKNLIEENPVSFATVDGESNPNVIGVAYVKVVSDNEIVITDNFMKQTRENIIANSNVCLAVWDKDWNGSKIIGTATYHKDGKWKEFVKKMPENEGMAAKAAILIKVNKIIKLR